jgi:Icc-related predicted phosphoesterase
MAKIFFATDLHGAEGCWRKFLNAGEHYGVDLLVLGGDMTGKAMVPVVERDGRWVAEVEGRRLEASDEQELEALERKIADRGLYPARMDAEREAALGADESLVDELFQERMLQTVERWMEIAASKLEGTGIRCFVCPGNDDVLEVDDVIATSPHVELAEGRVLELDGFEMASSGWTNPTPWETHREEDEESLRKRLEGIVEGLSEPGRAIFNFHVPPRDSGLDDAPALDDELRPKRGGQAVAAVGSVAVRDLISEHQPLLSLHGHIHESRGAVRMGRTLSVNAGSAYDEGVLQGALVDLNARKGKVRNYMLVEG